VRGRRRIVCVKLVKHRGHRHHSDEFGAGEEQEPYRERHEEVQPVNREGVRQEREECHGAECTPGNVTATIPPAEPSADALELRASGLTEVYVRHE